MNMKDISDLCDAGALRWTNHILERIFRRGITTEDVKCTLKNGEIIEQYPTDYPFPSCLVLGYSAAKKMLHVVCGSNGNELWLITAYYPSLNEWSGNGKKRSKT